MSELTEFLLARIAEDEEVARASDPYSWTADSGDVYAGHPTARIAEYIEVSWAAHIARHDPARVLAECEAKRRIVEDFEVLDADYRVTHDPQTEARRFQALIAASRIASVYADHPDYREEWRP